MGQAPIDVTFRFVLIGTLLTLMVACSETGVKKEQEQSPVRWSVPEEKEAAYPDQLKTAVIKFWTHQYRGEWDACFDMETPENKESIQRQWYRAYYRGGWTKTDIEVTRLVVDKKEGRARAYVKLTLENSASKQQKQMTLADRWREVDGQWYHHLYDPLIRLQELGRKRESVEQNKEQNK